LVSNADKSPAVLKSEIDPLVGIITVHTKSAIVDFPDPEGPTKAVVLPASNTQLKFFRTGSSYLVGYVKLTFSN
jgi:hypothetical protein